MHKEVEILLFSLSNVDEDVAAGGCWEFINDGLEFIVGIYRS